MFSSSDLFVYYTTSYWQLMGLQSKIKASHYGSYFKKKTLRKKFGRTSYLKKKKKKKGMNKICKGRLDR